MTDWTDYQLQPSGNMLETSKPAAEAETSSIWYELSNVLKDQSAEQ